jgi:2-methylisocitrate lyase-like PEP mutase family enzyme
MAFERWKIAVADAPNSQGQLRDQIVAFLDNADNALPGLLRLGAPLPRVRNDGEPAKSTTDVRGTQAGPPLADLLEAGGRIAPTDQRDWIRLRLAWQFVEQRRAAKGFTEWRVQRRFLLNMAGIGVMTKLLLPKTSNVTPFPGPAGGRDNRTRETPRSSEAPGQAQSPVHPADRADVLLGRTQAGKPVRWCLNKDAHPALPNFGLMVSGDAGQGKTQIIKTIIAEVADLAGIRDIAAATRLPFITDADDGYGDVKSVARLVAAYEAIGVGGFLIEDQDGARKQQRAEKAAGVVDETVIEAKLRTALAARSNPETFIIGRTDAYGPLGLDAAMRRAERFLKLGCDGIFIAGLKTEDDYRRVGAAFRGVYSSAAMFEGGDTPWLTPAELHEMGFMQVSYPASLIFRAIAAMRDGLAALRRHADGAQAMTPLRDGAAIRDTLDKAVELARWRGIEAEAQRKV